MAITANAQNSFNNPFGGPILWTTACSCTGGWYILMYDYKTTTPLALVFQFGLSRLNANYNIFSSGVNTVGSYQTGGECEIYVGESCMSLPVDGMITTQLGPGIGTSSF